MNSVSQQLLILLVVLGVGLYWGWHVWRYREIGCRKCDGKGNIMAKSLVLGHPVRRPCPRCHRDPWRRRRGAPESEK